MLYKKFSIGLVVCFINGMLHAEPKIIQLLVEQRHQNKNEVHLYALKSDHNLYEAVNNKDYNFTITDFQKTSVFRLKEAKKNKAQWAQSDYEKLDGRITCIGQPRDVLIKNPTDNNETLTTLLPLIIKQELIGSVFKGLARDILCVGEFFDFLTTTQPAGQEVLQESTENEKDNIMVREVGDGHRAHPFKIELVQDVPYFNQKQYGSSEFQTGSQLISGTIAPTMRLTPLLDSNLQFKPFQKPSLRTYASTNKDQMPFLLDAVTIKKNEVLRSYICRATVEYGGSFFDRLFNKKYVFKNIVISSDEQKTAQDIVEDYTIELPTDLTQLPFLPKVFFDPAIFQEDNYKEIISDNFTKTVNQIDIKTVRKASLYIAKEYAIIAQEGRYENLINIAVHVPFADDQKPVIYENSTLKLKNFKLTATAFDFTNKKLYGALYTQNKKVIFIHFNV